MTPNPGSHDALRLSCRCSPVLNQYGAGAVTTSRYAPDFEIDPACVLHGVLSGYVYESAEYVREPEVTTAALPSVICNKCGKYPPAPSYAWCWECRTKASEKRRRAA